MTIVVLLRPVTAEARKIRHHWRKNFGSCVGIRG